MNIDTPTKTATTPAPAMDAWAMSCSILVGLWKVEEVAEAELVSNQAAAKQNPFAAGVQRSVILSNIIRDTIKSLQYDLNQQARSSGLRMPKRGPSQ